MSDQRKKFWRCWLITFVAIISIALGGVIEFQTDVDPFDVWSNEKYEYGYNQIKLHLNDYDRVYKPYQYAAREPRVVFLGNSRTKWGLPPVWPGYDDDDVYNFGSNAFRVTEMEMYVNFLLKTAKPELVVIGLDSLQFQRPNHHDPGPIQQRLNTISLSPVFAFLSKLKETCLSIDMVGRSFDTIEASEKQPHHDPIILRGWRVDDSRFHVPERHRYLKSMWMYTRTYRKMSLDQVQLDALERMLKKLKQSGVEYHVFFVPTPADLQLSTIRRRGKWDQVEKIKRTIVEHTPFWDFGYVNSITANRRSYVDASHYRTAVGAMIFNRITGARISDFGSHIAPRDFGVRITKSNFDRKMRWMKDRLIAHEKENSDFARKLEENINNKGHFTRMLEDTVYRR